MTDWPTIQRLRCERGMTLIETLVVMLVLGVLAIASITMISGLFNANLRSQQMASQQASGQGASGYLTARLGAAKAPLHNLVDATQSTWTDPLSIGPDQLVFESGGDCFRVFYHQASKTIKAAKANGSCDTATALRPKRFPNDTVASSCQGATPTQMRSSCSTDPRYDPVLDTTNGSFVLATGVQDRAADNSPVDMFTYWRNDGTTQVNYTADSTADTVHNDYKTRTNLNNVAAVELSVPVDGTAGGASATQIRTRTTKQKIWIGGSGGTGAAGGGTAAAPALVAALPTSPADGQEVYLQSAAMASSGTIWHLRYKQPATGLPATDNAVKYPWQVLGGAPLFVRDGAGATTTSQTAVVAGTASLMTVAVAGEYQIEIGGRADVSPNGYMGSLALYSNGSHLMGIHYRADGWQHTSTQNRVTFNAGSALQFRIAADSSGASMRSWDRYVSLLPIRVG